MSDIKSQGVFKVIESGMHITTMWVVDGHFPYGIANADLNWPELGRWWLARVSINREQFRSAGIGTELVRRIQSALAERTDFKELLVAPGGYGSDEKKQWNFYVKNGFVPFEDALIWRRSA